MPSVYRPTVTRPIPPRAEIITKCGKRHARWRGKGGRMKTAPLSDDGTHVQDKGSVYWMEYTNEDGRLVRESTGCRDKQAAQQNANDRAREAERVRTGSLPKEELEAREHGSRPLPEHVAEYERSLLTKGTTEWHRRETLRRLRRVVDDCSFETLTAIRASEIERWVNSRLEEGMGPRTVNTYLASIKAFVNWARKGHRLLGDPLSTLGNVREQSDVRRQRRALTEEELARLLRTARERPLRDATTIRRGKRKGELGAKVRPELKAQLERLGLERALIYKTLVLTGLRRGELEKTRIRDVDLDPAGPNIRLPATTTKNRKAATIPLRADLASDMEAWLSGLEEGTSSDAGLFTVPKALNQILGRDLAAAGIPKRDADGRTIDVHALRHTTATHLTKSADVAPRTAQALMRHGTPELTMNRYTDPELLAKREALDALPLMPIEPSRSVAVSVVGETGRQGLNEASSDSDGAREDTETDAAPRAVSRSAVGGRHAQSSTGTPGERKAGDRSRTDDIQLGKLTFYH